MAKETQAQFHVLVGINDILFPEVCYRSGDFTVGDSDWHRGNDDQSFQELVASIETIGLRCPPTVRHHPKKKGKYELVTGWRRVAAVKYIAQKRGVKDLTLTVLCVDNMSEQDVVLEWLASATKAPINPPDIAYALSEMVRLYAEKDVQLSDNMAASMVGMNRSYISSLLRIARNGPEVLKMWRESAVQLPVKAIEQIVKLPTVKEQLEAYARAMTVKTRSVPSRRAKTKSV